MLAAMAQVASSLRKMWSLRVMAMVMVRVAGSVGYSGRAGLLGRRAKGLRFVVQVSRDC
jgi:hypothetical protein